MEVTFLYLLAQYLLFGFCVFQAIILSFSYKQLLSTPIVGSFLFRQKVHHHMKHTLIESIIQSHTITRIVIMTDLEGDDALALVYLMTWINHTKLNIQEIHIVVGETQSPSKMAHIISNSPIQINNAKVWVGDKSDKKDPFMGKYVKNDQNTELHYLSDAQMKMWIKTSTFFLILKPPRELIRTMQSINPQQYPFPSVCAIYGSFNIKCLGRKFMCLWLEKLAPLFKLYLHDERGWRKNRNDPNNAYILDRIDTPSLKWAAFRMKEWNEFSSKDRQKRIVKGCEKNSQFIGKDLDQNLIQGFVQHFIQDLFNCAISLEDLEIICQSMPRQEFESLHKNYNIYKSLWNPINQSVHYQYPDADTGLVLFLLSAEDKSLLTFLKSLKVGENNETLFKKANQSVCRHFQRLEGMVGVGCLDGSEGWKSVFDDVNFNTRDVLLMLNECDENNKV